MAENVNCCVDVRSELERKTMEKFINIYDRYNRKALSAGQTLTELSVIMACTEGLISSEKTSLITAFYTDLRHKTGHTPDSGITDRLHSHVRTGGGKILYVYVCPETFDLRVYNLSDNKFLNKVKNTSLDLAVSKAESFIKQIAERGGKILC